MKSIMDGLSGYKTYSAVAGLVVVALLEGVLKVDIPGVALDNNWVALLLGALGIGGIRDAISKMK